MDWSNIQKAIDFIEENIFNEINYCDESAKLMFSSSFHFHRAFSMITGITIGEYIRKRKLTLAGQELFTTKAKIVDVSLKYGYESPESFTKAFARFHGVNPSEARISSANLKFYHPLIINFNISGGNIVKPIRFFENKELLLAGCLVKNEGGDLWAKWEEMDSKENDDVRYAHHHLVDGHQAHEVRFFPENGEYIFTGLEVSREINGTAWEYMKVPATTYAVFDIDQKINQQPQFEDAYKWLDENKNIYKQMEWDAGGRVALSSFIICQYDHGGKYKENKIMEYWIPLIKITV